jgi:hypothetical protein
VAANGLIGINSIKGLRRDRLAQQARRILVRKELF